MQMTKAELARYNARRNAAKAQQDANDRRNGQALTPELRGGKNPSKTPWCVVTRGMPRR
jgi:hypothetical protein